MECEHIIRQCKKAHYSGWSDEELQICIEKAKQLSRKDLFQLFNSKWMDKNAPLRSVFFFLLHKEEIEKRGQPISVSRMHIGRCLLQKNLIEEYTIASDEIIGSGYFDGYSNLKKINIKFDFLIDDDCYTRFGSYTPNLERFEVKNNRSPFFTQDGILYMNMDKAWRRVQEKEKINYHLWNCELDSQSGIMLVAMPPKYKELSFEIPDFVEVIGCSAFCGSNLESLTIPNSLKYIGLGGLVEMYHLKELKVPNSNSVGYIGLSGSGKKKNVKGQGDTNQSIRFFRDCNNVGHNVDIMYSDSDDELGAEHREFWCFLLNDNVFDEDLE